MGLLLGAYFAGAGACNPISYYGRVDRSAGVTAVEDLIARNDSGIRSSIGFPMSGYTDSAGMYHANSGYIRLLESDSLEIILHGERVFERSTPDSIVPGGFLPNTRLVVPRGAVVTVFYDKPDAMGAPLDVLGGTAEVLRPRGPCGG